ncbi:MAG: ABC transporter substrate-binding protein [Bacteroidota bacterium]
MKQSLLFLGFLFFCLLIQPACVSDSPSGGTDATGSDKISVHTRIQAEPDYLNPIMGTRSWTTRVMNQIFQTLVDYDPFTLKLSPVLAKSLPDEIIVEEGPYKGKTAFVFEIHDEAVWDNGMPIVATDYLFTLKALFNPRITIGAPLYRAHLGTIQDVILDPENPKKMTVVTREPYIRSSYVTGFYVYPEHVYDPDGLLKDIALADLTDADKSSKLAEEEPKIDAFAKQFTSTRYTKEKEVITGSGPYQLSEWIAGDRLILKKKENWWGDQLADRYPMLTAIPDEIVYHPVRDATAALNLLRNKEVDFVGRIPGEPFSQLQGDKKFQEEFDLHTPNTTIYNYIGINTQNPKLSDKRVRKALAYCIDTDEIVNTIKLGGAQKITSPIPPQLDYYHKGLEPYSLNVEKAKVLLEEAGWKDTDGNGIVDKVIDGEKTDLTLEYLLTPQNIDSRKIAVLFKEGARKAGIDIVPTPTEANLLIRNRGTGDFELLILGAGVDLGMYDPKQYWHTSSGGNYFGFGNADSDALIDEIRQELDPVKRKKLYMEFQELLYDEMPVIFLYNTRDRIAISNRFKNFKASMKSPAIFENYLGLDAQANTD